MDISFKNVFDILSEKKVTELHHANSVATACQFLRNKALMSRGTVEQLGLTQTAQSSDKVDKSYSIWFDVFLDSVDIHARAKCANVYGPVLFVFDINIINRSNTGRLWVTKLNPTKWAGRKAEDRWFQGTDDLQENFVKGSFDQMILLRHSGGMLSFGKYLKKIVLDDPQLKTSEDVDFYSMSVGALRLAMQDANLDIPIERRNCEKSCKCRSYWDDDEEEERLFKMFDPKI